MGLKLKDIVKESWPSRTMDETPKLSLDEKRQFLEAVSGYNQYRSKIYSEDDLVEIAQQLSNIAERAEILTLSEADEQFDKITINRNIKELKKLSGDFTKVATEAQSLKQRMLGLYEDMGGILNRYFEIREEDTLDELYGDEEDSDDYETVAKLATSDDPKDVKFAKDKMKKIRK